MLYRRMCSIVCCLVLAVPGISFAVTNTETDPRLYLNIPYSLVDAWRATDSSFSFPSDASKLTRQQILIIQHYLSSRGYDLNASGVWDKITRDTLNVHQGPGKAWLAPETKKNINSLYAFLYCPVGQTSRDVADFRLDNVNKARVLPSEYVPNNLVLELDNSIPSNGPVCLEAETYHALKRMYQAAADDGVNLYVTSSYRGEDSQDYLLQVMVRRIGEYAHRIVALPGRSEHNLGTSADFAAEEDGKRVPLTAGKQIEWLYKNAAEFGFVNSYPEGKEAITGFRAEPWHWRYVGPNAATQVEVEGITLVEFLDQYRSSLKQQISNAQNAFQSLEDIVIGG